MLDRNQTVASLVLDHSECAEVFGRHRIDFCCRGNVSIEAAAAARGVDPNRLIEELSCAIETRQADRPIDSREISTPRLIAYIVLTHHDYARTTLPFVGALATKVGRVHGDQHPRLRELASAVEDLAAVLLPHLDEEEQTLFPLLTDPAMDRLEALTQLARMEEDHHAVAELLARIRAACDDFAIPGWACNSYRTLFAELEQLERDIHVHVHLENHVLKPRFGATAAAE